MVITTNPTYQIIKRNFDVPTGQVPGVFLVALENQKGEEGKSNPPCEFESPIQRFSTVVETLAC